MGVLRALANGIESKFRQPLERATAIDVRYDHGSIPVVWAAYYLELPWPKRDGQDRKPARAGGAYVVLAGAEPVLYVERSGRGIVTLTDAADPRMRPSFEALAAFVIAGRGRKLSLEKVDGEPVVGSAWEPLLVELGFRQGPRKLTLSA